LLLREVQKILDAEVLVGAEKLDMEVHTAFGADLLSDVMTNSREGDLWITRQIHQNIVAVASLKDLAGIILVRGAEPAADTLEKAVRENIPLFMADLPAFETAGRIYQMICPRGA
jgi:predicted transcriptional regulator